MKYAIEKLYFRIKKLMFFSRQFTRLHNVSAGDAVRLFRFRPLDLPGSRVRGYWLHNLSLIHI